MPKCIRPTFFVGFCFFYFSFSQGNDRFIVHVPKTSGVFIPTLILGNTDFINSASCTLKFYKINGQLITERTLTLEPGQTSYYTPEHLSSSNETSHIGVSGDESWKTSIIYQSTSGGSPVHVHESSIRGERFRIYQGDWGTIWDGIALLNGDTTSTIEVSQFVSESKVQTEVLSLNANEKGLMVFSSVFANIEGSYFELQGGQPFMVLSLRGSLDQQYLWENQAIPLEGSNNSPQPFEVLWETALSSPYWRDYRIINDKWYIPNGSDLRDSTILDINTGQSVPFNDATWTRDIFPLDNGEIYYLLFRDSTNGSLRKITADGSDLETINLTGIFGSIATRIGAVSENKVFVQKSFCDGSGKLIKIDKNTGTIDWSHSNDSSCFNYATYSDQHIFLSSQSSNLQVLNRSNGNLLWEWPTPSYVKTVEGDAIYGTIDTEDTIFRGDTQGNLVWEYNTAYNETQPLVSSSGCLIYIWGKPSGNRDLIFLDKLNGNVLWEKKDFLEFKASYVSHKDGFIISAGSLLYHLDQVTGEVVTTVNLEPIGVQNRLTLHVYEGKLFGYDWDQDKLFCFQLP